MKIFEFLSPTGSAPAERETPIRNTAGEDAGTQAKGASYESRIVHPSSPDAALTVSAVYRAMEVLANTEAQFQIQYQKLNSAGGNYIADMWGVGQRLNYLLQVQPNPITTAVGLMKQIVIRRRMKGNAFVYVERTELGDVKALWLADSGGYNIETGTYTLTYLSDSGQRLKVEAPRADVLHFPNTFRYEDGFWGKSTIQYAIDTLSLVKTEGQQALESAAKGGRVKLLIGEDRTSSQGLLAGGLYSKPETKAYAKEINDEIYSQDVVSLRGLDKAQSISMSAQEMQMIELLNIGMDDISRFFGVPRPLLMLDTNSHYTTYTNATLEFLQRTVQPDIVELEQEFQRKLLTEKDFGRRRFHFCEQPLLRLDREAQAKVDEINIRTGAKSVNEVRKQYDQPAVDGGDMLYLSTNLAELGSEKLRGVPGQKNDGEGAGEGEKQ